MKSRIETTQPESAPFPSAAPHAAHLYLAPLRSRRLFFEERDLPRIQRNARHPLFAATVDGWKLGALAGLNVAWEEFEKSNNIVFGMGQVWARYTDLTVVHLLEPTPEREAALLEGMARALKQEAWDYILEEDYVVGVMRASMATSQLLFAREVLGDAVGAQLETSLLDAIAEKGVIPCLRTIEAMADPSQHRGWRHAPGNEPFHEIDMSFWPLIFGSNNLRGAPTMGLGLGSLALLGHHPMATHWLQRAELSAQTLLGLFTPDGTYFEGLSYSDYTLRTILSFCAAHKRLIGSIDWSKTVNWSGYMDYVMAMQAGENADGAPDVVNFSDAGKSIYPCVASWIEQETGDSRAQYVAEQLSTPGYFLDLLWFRSERPAFLPDPTLKNWRSELDWVVCRSGWRRNDGVLAFRSGFPVNHEHADRNSLIFKIYGERLLTDHFRGAYDRNDPNWSLRWTSAHNAVLVDGGGSHYHNGEYGVFEGLAEARIVRYCDQQERIWWSSDATHGYRLINPAIRRVMRTVAFAKPGLIFMLDEVLLDEQQAEVEVRFFPDHRDGHAVLDPLEQGFRLARPGARLHAVVAGNPALKVERGVLDPAEPVGKYVYNPASPIANAEFSAPPFIALRSAAASTHIVVTVMAAQPASSATTPPLAIKAVEDGWNCRAAEVHCHFRRDDGGFTVAW